MTIEDALFQHQLDVAGLEIASPYKQLENLEVWMSKVREEDKDKAKKLLIAAKARSKKLRAKW